MNRFRLARSIVFRLGLAGGAALTGCGIGLADSAPALPLVAHHATYKLSLIRSTGSKAPQAVDGVLSYDFSGSSCEGYATTLRQMTALQPQEGDAHVSDMRTATFEGGDANDYRFKVSTAGDASGGDTVDGKAHRGADGAVSVDIDHPQSEKAALGDVLFPTEHLLKIIDTAKGGGRLLSAQVFDGSETGKKVFNTLSVIGSATTAVPAEKAAQIDELKTVRRWPVTISYFDASKTDAAPDYVLSFDLYENGISRALKLDYGDFVLAGEMTDLQIKPEKGCTH